MQQHNNNNSNKCKFKRLKLNQDRQDKTIPSEQTLRIVFFLALGQVSKSSSKLKKETERTLFAKPTLVNRRDWPSNTLVADLVSICYLKMIYQFYPKFERVNLANFGMEILLALITTNSY